MAIAFVYPITKVLCKNNEVTIVDLSYRRLKMLLRISEKGSVSSAAIDLGISQPALSRTLNETERDLNIRIFDRSGRGVHTTEIGKRFLFHAREIITQHDMIKNDLQLDEGQLSGEARVVMPESVARVLFIPLIKSFNKRHPLVKIRVRTSYPDNIPQLLHSDQADVAIISDTSLTRGLKLREVMSENLHLIGPKNSFNSIEQSISLENVSKLPLLLPASDRFRTLIDRAFITSRLKQKISQEIDNPFSLLDLVRQNEGYAILAYSIAHRSVENGDLMSLQIVSPNIERILSTALPVDRPHTRLLRAVEAEIIKLAKKYNDVAKWKIL